MSAPQEAYPMPDEAKGVEDGALEQLPQLLHMSVGFSH